MRRAGRGDPDLLEQRDRSIARGRLVHVEVRPDRLGQLAPDRVERVERGERVLEDRANLLAADAAHLVVGQVVDAPATERDPTVGNAPRRVDEADDGGTGDRLARTRLAHDAEHLPGSDREAHVVNGDQRPPARRKLDAQALHREERAVGVARPGHRRRSCSTCSRTAATSPWARDRSRQCARRSRSPAPNPNPTANRTAH